MVELEVGKPMDPQVQLVRFSDEETDLESSADLPGSLRVFLYCVVVSVRFKWISRIALTDCAVLSSCSVFS